VPNLISVGKLSARDKEARFKARACKIEDVETGVGIAEATLTPDGLYELRGIWRTRAAAATASVVVVGVAKVDMNQWHLRMGHLGEDSLWHLKKGNMVDGMEVSGSIEEKIAYYVPIKG